MTKWQAQSSSSSSQLFSSWKSLLESSIAHTFDRKECNEWSQSFFTDIFHKDWPFNNNKFICFYWQTGPDFWDCFDKKKLTDFRKQNKFELKSIESKKIPSFSDWIIIIINNNNINNNNNLEDHYLFTRFNHLLHTTNSVTLTATSQQKVLIINNNINNNNNIGKCTLNPEALHPEATLFTRFSLLHTTTSSVLKQIAPEDFSNLEQIFVSFRFEPLFGLKTNMDTFFSIRICFVSTDTCTFVSKIYENNVD